MKDVGCMFPTLKRCKLKLIYRARKCMMEEGFFCDMLGWLQLFQFSSIISYVILCNVLFPYLILFSIFGRNLVGFYVDFVRLDLN